MGQRRDRLDARLANQTTTRRENSLKKDKERVRKSECNIKLIKESKFPYTPALMSWLSAEIGKKSSQITEADVQAFFG